LPVAEPAADISKILNDHGPAYFSNPTAHSGQTLKLRYITQKFPRSKARSSALIVTAGVSTWQG
jgi:hypothetical protein